MLYFALKEQTESHFILVQSKYPSRQLKCEHLTHGSGFMYDHQ